MPRKKKEMSKGMKYGSHGMHGPKARGHKGGGHKGAAKGMYGKQSECIYS